MGKILGIDLGTNSIGLSVRNTDKDGDLLTQLDFFSTSVFKCGVGTGKTGEFSYAAERTKYRLTRNRYKTRKYRRYGTLNALIENGLCPLTKEELYRWSRYSKAEGLDHPYPQNARFEQWIRLDFDYDGVSDYPSPFHLRAELVNRRLDLTEESERYKLGRALYHFALHRGFKSSKGETLKEQEENEASDLDNELSELKKSEEKKSEKIVEYMTSHALPTVGCACAKLLDEGIRVRESEFLPVRSQLKDEVRKILEFQGFSSSDALWNSMLSEKKGVGTIFYKRPLRSQKGLVGKCTLEPNKPRCPISHPEFEIFRAWSFINNIRFRFFAEDSWEELPLEMKRELFNDKFLRAKDSFDFKEICDWLKRKTGSSSDFSKDNGTINYSNKTGVPGCPVCSRLKKLLGDDWQTIRIQGDGTRVRKHKDGTEYAHPISYTYEDIWHVCFSSDEMDDVLRFGQDKLHWDERNVKELTRLWFNIRDGYAKLSLKAIRNINKLLCEGFFYPYAVMMAKIPDIIGKSLFDDNREGILENLQKMTEESKQKKSVYQIVQRLVSNYKSLDYPEQFAFKNTDYSLDEKDLMDIRNSCSAHFGEKTWDAFPYDKKNDIIQAVATLYQQFFASKERNYPKLPRLDELFFQWLHAEFPDYKGFENLYHPSMIEFYAPAKEIDVESNVQMRLLGSPVIDAIRNPMAMRVLHTLRRQINELLRKHVIDEETRVVVEVSRDLNDANMRWAINEFQRRREKENEEYKKKLEETYKGRTITKKDIEKYRLWTEQGFMCLYTGEMIGITDLLDGNRYDFEHTLPRSKSFDDSLKNQTICATSFNRNVKRNLLPCELENYADIKERIKPWIDKTGKLKTELEAWKSRTRSASTKERKDYCIRQRHLIEMELDYWGGKVERFTMKEITQGFRNNQLNDTRIITKYAYHYLRSLFSNVIVQRGENTAAYRKMLGIQSIDEKKDRSKHSHHAIDATVLTLIPSAAQRERMLELFYRIEEESKAGHNVDELRNALQKERRLCGLNVIPDIASFIESRIFINHINKDQTFSTARRKIRKRGHLVLKSDGMPMYSDGDSFRAVLCNDSFYGANMTKEGKEMMVIRKLLTSLKEKDIDTIIDKNVREAVNNAIRDYMEDGFSFAKAITMPIWMTGKDGRPRKTDKNGYPISPIRHVRCNANSAVTFSKAVKLKLQKDHSGKALIQLPDRAHKEYYYTISGGNYTCLVYAAIIKNKLQRKYKFISNYEAANLRFEKEMDFFSEPYFKELSENKKTFQLQAVLKVGTRVLVWKESPEELNDKDIDLSKRLYVVYKFNNAGSDYVFLKHHLETKESKVEAIPYEGKEYQGTLKLGANNFNCLVEGVDFKVDEFGIPHLFL